MKTLIFATAVLMLPYCVRGQSIFDFDQGDGGRKPFVGPAKGDPPQKSRTNPIPDAKPRPVPDERPEPALQRKEPPSAEKLDKAMKTVQEVFKADLAAPKTAAEYLAASQRFLELSTAENDDSSRYALLKVAIDFAIKGKSYQFASNAVANIENTYNVDGLLLRVKALVSIGESLNNSASVRAKTEFLQEMDEPFDAAVAAERYGIADIIADTGTKIAKSSGSSALIKTAQAMADDAKTMGLLFKDYNAALSVLAKRPEDPTAANVAGKYLCLVKDNWTKGLHLLSIGTDAKLKLLASAELKALQDKKITVDLADAWWEIYDKEDSIWKIKARAHAAKYYNELRPQLSGLAEAKVSSRLSSLEKKKEVIVAKEPEQRPKEITDAIARHDLVAGMTLLEAKRSARRPITVISTTGNEKVYRWIIKGIVSSRQVPEPGMFVTKDAIRYRTENTYGELGYVEAVFVEDKLVKFRKQVNKP
jgi:hypothetical protein